MSSSDKINASHCLILQLHGHGHSAPNILLLLFNGLPGRRTAQPPLDRPLCPGHSVRAECRYSGGSEDGQMPRPPSHPSPLSFANEGEERRKGAVCEMRYRYVTFRPSPTLITPRWEQVPTWRKKGKKENWRTLAAKLASRPTNS